VNRRSAPLAREFTSNNQAKSIIQS